MRLKKYLQQQADKDAENLLTAKDKEFCLKLAESVQEGNTQLYSQLADNINGSSVDMRKSNRSLKLRVILCCVLAVAVAAVIIALPIVLKKNPVGDVYYFDENVIYRESNLEELNSDLKYFEIIKPENTVISIELNYDSVSGDSLFYTVKSYTAISEFNLFVIVNENFHYNFDISEVLISEQLTDYTLEYESSANDVIITNSINYKGVVQLNTEIVYIDYNQTIGLGDQAFFGDIQSVLKINN